MLRLTNGANDAGATVVLFGSIVDVQTAVPFQLGTVVEVIQSVTHIGCLTLATSVMSRV